MFYIPYFASAEGYSVQVLVGAVDNGGLYWRKSHGVQWLPWNTAATATPPAVYDLPLAAGYTGSGYRCEYYKTQEGIVHLNFTILRDGDTAFEPYVAFATLPAGFRPKTRLPISAVGDGLDYGNGILGIELQIDINGAIFLFHSNASIRWIIACASFPTA